jgi:hypothetical protein
MTFKTTVDLDRKLIMHYTLMIFQGQQNNPLKASSAPMSENCAECSL